MGLNRMGQNVTALRLVAEVLVSALVVGPVIAAGRPDQLEEPRQTDGQPGFHVTTLPTDVMALGMGRPTKSVAIVGSWVTSDQVPNIPDTYYARPFWWDDDQLMVLLAYSIPNPEIRYSLSVHIEDSRGVPVFRFATPESLGNHAGLFLTTVLVAPGRPGTPPSPLPAGAYKVTVKIKSGDTSVGQRYWLIVFSSASVTPEAALRGSADEATPVR